MSDGDGGVFGGIGDELKKIGQSAASQVTGPDDSQSGSADASGQVGGFGKSILGQITGNSGNVGSSQSQDIKGQLGGFGSAVVGQVIGAGDAGETGSVGVTSKPHGFWEEMKALGSSVLGQVSGQELEDMKQKDDAFSKVSEAEVKARIKAIYDQHAARRKQETHRVEQQGKQVEEQKNEFVKEKKKEQMDVSVAQTRANAEIKNLGAE